MEKIDYWRFAEEFTVVQATLLILGRDPSGLDDYFENSAEGFRPSGYTAISTALRRDVRKKRIPAEIVFHTFTDEFENEIDTSNIDWNQTLLSVETIKNWLKRKNFEDVFFLKSSKPKEGFLDKDHEYYAPKLAAAVSAWKTVTSNQELLEGKSPKQAIDKWLRENAKEYKLTKDDGNPNQSAIEEISKIANWNPSGGAVKTPTRVKKNPPTPSEPINSNTYKFETNEEIPF